MNDINWELIILVIIVGLIAFALLGIYIGTRISSDKKRIRELEGELSDTRKELEGYRAKVNNHFKKTSELFTQMTSTYKAVYQHLAEGSHELCTTDAALLNVSNEEFLKVTHNVEQQAAKEEPAQSVERPVSAPKSPETPDHTAEPPEKPESAEAEPEDAVPEAKAEQPVHQEPPPVAEGVPEEEAADEAEPATTPEESEIKEADRLRVVGS